MMLFEQLDLSRRRVGEMLDRLGLGPVETSSRVVFSEPGVTLRRYENSADASPVLLIVPAPIKRTYIWDLAPCASVVRHCLRKGVQVYLIDWARPGPGEQGFGLAEYADRFVLDCLDAVEREVGLRDVFLAGHSLGGTFAAIFSALHPQRVRGLVLLGAPLHFGRDAGAFAPLVALAPPVHKLTATSGDVPGSWLSLVSSVAAPDAFQWSRWIDWLGSLPDPRALQTHFRVERWMLDETPLARQLFEDVVELLYREDRFMRGTLLVRGQRAAPELLNTPLLNVVDPRSRVVPPQSVLPFHHAARSVEKRLLTYEGDTGVALQHVGMLVGARAHQYLWPEILQWIRARSGPG